MSIISKLTGSLPNPLSWFQGTWEVQYKNKFIVETPIQDSSDAEGNKSFTDSVKDFAVNQTNSALSDPWETLPFDSIISVNEIEDTNIVNQPIEKGSFRSVNKVKKPKMFKVVASTGGISYGIEESLEILKYLLPLSRIAVSQNMTVADIGNMLTSAKEIISGKLSEGTVAGAFDTLEKATTIRLIPMEFRIITPHDTTDNLNLIKFDYTFRRETGRNMLIVEMTFQEILENTQTADQMQEEIVKNASDAKELVGGLRSIVGV